MSLVIWLCGITTQRSGRHTGETNEDPRLSKNLIQTPLRWANMWWRGGEDRKMEWCIHHGERWKWRNHGRDRLRLTVDPWWVPPPKAMLMPIGHAAAGNLIDVSGLKPWWCLWSRQLLRALSGPVVLLYLGTVFVVYGVTRNHVEAHGPCSRWLWRARRLLLRWYRWL